MNKIAYTLKNIVPISILGVPTIINVYQTYLTTTRDIVFGTGGMLLVLIGLLKLRKKAKAVNITYLNAKETKNLSKSITFKYDLIQVGKLGLLILVLNVIGSFIVEINQYLIPIAGSYTLGSLLGYVAKDKKREAI